MDSDLVVLMQCKMNGQTSRVSLHLPCLAEPLVKPI